MSRFGYRLIERPGGRRLAYSQLGAPRGRPLLYCHGFPSSRKEALLIHRAAEATGWRIIAPDRPGYGDSDNLPGRALEDWPDDVLALIDRLGIGRFALIGVSGGGPYALACVSRIPERIRACALACPLGPLAVPELLADMAPPARMAFQLARSTPLLARLVFGGLTPRILGHWPRLVARLRDHGLPEADRVALADVQTWSILERTVADAMRRGAQGARRDLRLYTHDWNISWSSLSVPIDLWQGEADRTVPTSHARWYAARLPRCQARFLPDEGHYSLPLRHATSILASLGRDR